MTTTAWSTDRIKNGFERVLSASEAGRGYLYIATDGALEPLVNVDDFPVIWRGERVEHRRIRRGRITIPRQMTKDAEGMRLLVRFDEKLGGLDISEMSD